MTHHAEIAQILQDVPVGVPETHRCGRCSGEAVYVDRSGSGAVLYVCKSCGDGKGYPTFVALKEIR